MSFNNYKVLQLCYDGKNDEIPFQYKIDITNSVLVENEISLNLALEFEFPQDGNKEKLDLSLNIKSDKYQNIENNFSVVKKTNDSQLHIFDDKNNSLKLELDNIVDKLNKSINIHTENIKKNQDSYCLYQNKRVYQNTQERFTEIDPKNKIILDKTTMYQKNYTPTNNLIQNKTTRVYQNNLLPQIDENNILNNISRAYQNKEIIDLTTGEKNMTHAISIDSNTIQLNKKIDLIQKEILRSYKNKNKNTYLTFLSPEDEKINYINSSSNEKINHINSYSDDEKINHNPEDEKINHNPEDEKINHITSSPNTKINSIISPADEKINHITSSSNTKINSIISPNQKINHITTKINPIISSPQIRKNNRPKQHPQVQKQSSKNLIALLNENDVSFQDIQIDPSSTTIKNGDNIDDTISNKLFYHLKLLLSVDSINLSTNIIFIVTELMKFIDNFDLIGKDKKSIIINTIHKYLHDENTEHNIDYIINTICPELIDILISIDKRKIKIKQKMNCFIPWCS